MKIKPSTRNISIALTISMLLAYKLLLASQDFPSTFTNGLQRTVIFIASIILILNLIYRLKYKSVLVLGYIALTIAFSYLNLWKTATRNYLEEKDKFFSGIVTTLHGDTSNFSLGLFQDSVAYRRGTDRQISPLSSDAFQGSLISLSKNTGVREIEKDKFITLFIFSRFIDNGYGLAYITPSDLEELYKQENYRLNGYQITGLSNVEGNWYYISFT